MSNKNLRIGTGFDVHRLVPNRQLCLGGIVIPFELGLAGHSDGDVLVHAVIDALLGAASLGDIGIFFPPGEPETKDMMSGDMLTYVVNLLEKKNYVVINIDTVVICERPRLSNYYASIKKNFANLLNIDVGRVNVKAKTAEQLGEIGAGQAIAAQAVALLELP